MYDEDLQIINQYLNGDIQAFEKIVGKYIKTIFSFTKRLTGNVDAATDITQETFIKCWKSIHKYDLKQNFKTWLFTIARNTAIDFMRKRKEYVFSDFDNSYDDTTFSDTLVDNEPLPSEIFEQKEIKQTIDNLLNQLSIDQKVVVILHDIEGLTFDEIGIVLHKPLNTVKSQYRRSIQNLKNLLLSPAPKQKP